MLHMFYSVVESVISSAIICRGSSIRARDLKNLNKLIKKADSVLGTPLEPLELIVQRRSFGVCSKILQIFYKSVVESVISSAIIFWGSAIRARDLKKNSTS
ncbi:hypothetical protein AMECASPLE_028374 [Ameca splendens]|uniref:Uncharacterized protein n=1 Tax=Ameca splendens TaxID=208324 RepID=A0ABV0Z4J1_9TELE